MNDQRRIADQDLHRYVDDELDPIRREEVRHYLAQHPEVARAVDTLAAQREALRAALAPIAAEAVPAHLSLMHLIEKRRQAHINVRTGIAAMLALTIGGIAGWYGRGSVEPARHGIAALAAEATTSYQVYAPDFLRPVELDAANSIQLEQWVSERLQRPIAAPDLSKADYRLLGGRLVATLNGPAALFLYEDDQGTRVGMLVRPMAIEQDAPMSDHSDGQVAGVAWSNRGLGYSLVGAGSAEALHPLAEEVRRQVGGAI